MDGQAVRQLVRAATQATLATLDAQSGHPYASLVEIATLPDAQPILLISRLARHSRNLERDPRASLLIDQRTAAGSALASERTTLIGRVLPSSDADCRRRYLARHPGAAPYAGFADFGFHAMQIESGHLIAGFGRITEAARQEIVLDMALVRELALQEAEVCETVNVLAEREGVEARLIGLDIEGLDVRRGAQVMRQLLAIDANLLAYKEKMCRLMIAAMTSAERRPA